MDEGVINEELDDLLQQRLKKINNSQKSDHHIRHESVKLSAEFPRTSNDPALVSRTASDFKPALGRSGATSNTGRTNARIECSPKDRMTSLVEGLLQNSMKNRLMTMVHQKVEEIK